MYYKNHFIKTALSPFSQHVIGQTAANALIGGAAGAVISSFKNRNNRNATDKKKRFWKSVGIGAGVGAGYPLVDGAAKGTFTKRNRDIFNYNRTPINGIS